VVSVALTPGSWSVPNLFSNGATGFLVRGAVFSAYRGGKLSMLIWRFRPRADFKLLRCWFRRH